MAIKLKDGTVLRNLEGQVQYLTSYHDENLGIAQWGIRVVDRIDSAVDLPVPYDGVYGDAIAVGTKPPYFFYIWTRSAIAGEPGYWFDYGEISIVGPQGPKGDTGPQGPVGESTRWYAGLTPSPGSNNDLFLDTSNGNVFQYYNDDWNLIGNIRGPQGIQGRTGPQGPQGIQGPVGPQGPIGPIGRLLKIAGIITDINQLPKPSSLNDLTVAYLLYSSNIYNLWIQVGDSPDTAIWRDIGRFNEGTAVYSNSSYQPIWDADTKVDKVIAATGFARVYTITAEGKQSVYEIATTDNSTKPGRLVCLRGATSCGTLEPNATIAVQTPINPYAVANKKYVDDYALAKDTSETTYNQVYVKSANGGQGTINVTKQVIADCVVQRQSDGNIYVPVTPAEDVDATSKKYVDNNSVVSLRYTFESLDYQTLLVVYLTMKKNQYEALEPYEYFINKDITSPVKGLPCFCERQGTLTTIYWDPSNDVFKCSASPDDEYELIQTEIM